tara:strand:+ start:3371 stop:3580 length:210 start_codon:yes stop_codon:yes gene_type:complete
MKFKVHENGSAEIFFSEEEIKIINDKKQLVMEPVFFKHFSNLLLNAIMNWQKNCKLQITTDEDTEVITK